MGSKKRVAVLGGGVGALSAAFYLTEQPGWDEKFEITVYQQGWRLGGKCASGHDMRPGYGNRIIEHGLHIFAGFYDQSFDLLRRAYDVLDRPAGHPNRTVWQAFSPEDTIALVDNSFEQYPDLTWYLNFEPNDSVPGDDLGIPSVEVAITKLVEALINFSPDARHNLFAPPTGAPPSVPHSGLLHGALDLLKKLAKDVERHLEALAAQAIMRDVIHMIEKRMKELSKSEVDKNMTIMMSRFIRSAYMVQAILHGVAADNVLQEGYDCLDKYEFSEWLYQNAVVIAERYPEWGDPHMRAQLLIDWAPVATMYDYVFGFGNGGDTAMRSFAAGTALRSFMLMISYKGHFFWKMRGAMGDVVIAPLYLALKQRGVKFEYFTRVTALNPNPVLDEIASIDMVRQAELADPQAGYRPLVEFPLPGWGDNTLEGWPNEPLWDQLKDGAALKTAGRNFEADHVGAPGAGDRPFTLKKGEDFDEIVIGISVGGLKQVCSQLPERLPHSKWGPMFDSLTLTRTCAMQVWFNRTMEDLGSQAAGRTLTGADQPFSTWSDMSHLLSRENWTGEERPLAIAYWCGQIPGDAPPAEADRIAREDAKKWLQDNVGRYWTEAGSANSEFGFAPGLLHCPDPGADGGAFAQQFVKANCAPSDLYVQSPKNSVYNRMDANESGFTNLFPAGDWTRNGLNSGCAESAARSGYRCALAMVGKLPPLNE
ncbi:NAD(P)-binding protein [Qipengyuania sp. 6B39]|uniref:NAD(P)-binding protein n=1 Tax=Qipengyuania proteolytica TaxID=2867239 RepID=UPI001C8A5E6B|nr:NAD(P)-binding protein [Qipengyuania proteolytica]MBX7495106.1 NAD(P)-binding protein [Qipengyuania proteolytica]